MAATGCSLTTVFGISLNVFSAAAGYTILTSLILGADAGADADTEVVADAATEETVAAAAASDRPCFLASSIALARSSAIRFLSASSSYLERADYSLSSFSR